MRGHNLHEYEIRPRKDKRGVDLISDALPFGRLWYDTPDNAIGYAKHRSRSHNAIIRVYDAAGNVIETHEHAGGFLQDAIGDKRKSILQSPAKVTRATKTDPRFSVEKVKGFDLVRGWRGWSPVKTLLEELWIHLDPSSS